MLFFLVAESHGWLTHQPPFARYRRWEIAGATHAETPRWVAEVPPPLDMGQACTDPANSAPHHGSQR
jgi:hypothetical protein